MPSGEGSAWAGPVNHPQHPVSLGICQLPLCVWPRAPQGHKSRDEGGSRRPVAGPRALSAARHGVSEDPEGAFHQHAPLSPAEPFSVSRRCLRGSWAAIHQHP